MPPLLLALTLACSRATAPPPHIHVHDTAHTGDTGATSLPPYDGPLLLSETGLTTPGGALADGVIPFSVRWPLWSDGADKERWLWLPPAATIDVSDVDAWRLPVGTKAWKTFRVGGVAIETRLMEKQADGWTAVSFLWRDDGADADAVPDGVPNARGTTHDVPDRETCWTCHRGAADGLLGVGALQLAGQPGMDTLAARLSAPLPADLNPPGDGATRDALTWLHAQCGSCHNDVHPFSGRRPLRLTLPVGLTDPAEAPARRTGLGLVAGHPMAGAELVLVPGQPDASQLYVRANQRGRMGMPPVGSEVIDAAGLAALRAWITDLSP